MEDPKKIESEISTNSKFLRRSLKEMKKKNFEATILSLSNLNIRIADIVMIQ